MGQPVSMVWEDHVMHTRYSGRTQDQRQHTTMVSLRGDYGTSTYHPRLSTRSTTMCGFEPKPGTTLVADTDKSPLTTGDSRRSRRRRRNRKWLKLRKHCPRDTKRDSHLFFRKRRRSTTSQRCRKTRPPRSQDRSSSVAAFGVCGPPIAVYLLSWRAICWRDCEYKRSAGSMETLTEKLLAPDCLRRPCQLTLSAASLQPRLARKPENCRPRTDSTRLPEPSCPPSCSRRSA